MQSPFLVTIDTLHMPSKRGRAMVAVAVRTIDPATSAAAPMPIQVGKRVMKPPRYRFCDTAESASILCTCGPAPARRRPHAAPIINKSSNPVDGCGKELLSRSWRPRLADMAASWQAVRPPVARELLLGD